MGTGLPLPAMQAEGWYRDPYHLHDDRWFSDGRPTDLVRDAGREGHDPPPNETPTGPLIEAASVGSDSDDDLRFADPQVADAVDALLAADR